jgi:hypothetical protein
MYGREEVRRGVSWGDLRERGHLEALGIDRRIILKWIFKKLYVEALTGLVWIWIGTGRGLL